MRVLQKIVAASIHRPWLVVLVGLALTVASAYYAATHFAITTDTEELIASDVPYRQDEIAFAAAFPETQNLIIAVIEAETPEGEGLRHMLERATDQGYAAACDALALADCTQAAGRIACKTIVAYGSEDKAAPRSAALALADAIPGATLHEIPGAAHLPLLHHAALCTAILTEILPEANDGRA